jgi:hypothetical protein
MLHKWVKDYSFIMPKNEMDIDNHFGEIYNPSKSAFEK